MGSGYTPSKGTGSMYRNTIYIYIYMYIYIYNTTYKHIKKCALCRLGLWGWGGGGDFCVRRRRQTHSEDIGSDQALGRQDGRSREHKFRRIPEDEFPPDVIRSFQLHIIEWFSGRKKEWMKKQGVGPIPIFLFLLSQSTIPEDSFVGSMLIL